jgi:transposase
MKRFVECTDRGHSTLFPECLADWIEENNPVQVIDVFVDALNLAELGFDGVAPEATGRPSYHPSVLLKLYIYGYLNRIQSSRRLEREARRNVEVMWLTGRLVPDHKTIADFRKDNGGAIRKVGAQFIMLCRRLDLFTDVSIVIDGSKFKAVNNRDRNFTRAKMERRLAQIEEIVRYLRQLDSADRQEPSEVAHHQDNPAQGENRQAQGRGKAPAWAQGTDAVGARSADIADRSGLPLDGDEHPRVRRGGLQRSGRGRHRTPSDHYA